MRDNGAGPAAGVPLARFLERCRDMLASDNRGSIPDYIPELTRADPTRFGISLATMDGHVYQVGDSALPFTVQSISKAFVFALALETIGAERVEAMIGVEPSGDPFNSIRLRTDGRPFNPMVNAGAIACCGLMCESEGSGAFERILDTLSRFAGRKLAVDEAVFASERATGDRNRAIAWLLRNHGAITRDVDEVLDVYFRQCSVLVTARDLAVMGATLANRGVNPVTGERVSTPYAIARTLSVMTSTGMYDYAGEWIYRIGLPAKSGIGGGIVAALPAQFGLGTFSPLVDGHGNSVRGLEVCSALSSHFDLHVLNRVGDVRTCIFADYDIGGISSRRSRQPHEQTILDQHHADAVVLELVGALTFATVDYLSRRLAPRRNDTHFVILDFRRVPTISNAAAQVLADSLADVTSGGTTVVLSGIRDSSAMRATLDPWLARVIRLRRFALLDPAIEWVEDQIIYQHGGYVRLDAAVGLAEQALLAGLGQAEIAALAGLMQSRTYPAGRRIIVAGEAATSLFFLQSGMVSVKLPSGVRLATLIAGMVVGEMALLEDRRSADVWADTQVSCLELPLDAYVAWRDRHPHVGERIVRNLAVLLARRLIQANRKVELLTSY
jgi:glutaminase